MYEDVGGILVWLNCIVTCSLSAGEEISYSLVVCLLEFELSSIVCVLIDVHGLEASVPFIESTPGIFLWPNLIDTLLQLLWDSSSWGARNFVNSLLISA